MKAAYTATQAPPHGTRIQLLAQKIGTENGVLRTGSWGEAPVTILTHLIYEGTKMRLWPIRIRLGDNFNGPAELTFDNGQIINHVRKIWGATIGELVVGVLVLKTGPRPCVFIDTASPPEGTK